MYIQTIDELRRIVSERQSHFSQIREATNYWIFREYGIEDYLGLVARHFPFLDNGQKPVALLARQIASICVEDLACILFAKAIGYRQITMPFTRDTFTAANHDKKARIKIPWVEWSKKGNPVRTYQRIFSDKISNLEGKILSSISIKKGLFLQDYHSHMRVRVIPEFAALDIVDVSMCHVEALRLSSKGPSFVYENVDGQDIRRYDVGCTDFSRNDNPLRYRPPAKWYYPLYFSWFLDGSMILLETYENPRGEVAEAKRVFEETMFKIEQNTGYRPIVVEILPLDMDLLSCNKHIYEQGTEAFKMLETKAPNRSSDGSLVNLYANITETVFRFR